MWIKHILGPKTLPQKCTRCGMVLIEDKKNPITGDRISDPLDPQVIFANAEEDAIALVVPVGTPVQECAKA